MGGQARRAGADQELTGLVRELMLVTRHSVLEVADSYRGDDRLDRSAFILLSRLEAEGPMSIGQLADAFGLDVSTVNRQTAAMLRAGVAERIPDPGGGLARKLRITGEGRRRLRNERDWSVNGLRRVLRDWAPEEVSQLLTALTRFNQSIEELSGKPWPRTADSIPQENQDQFGTGPDGSLPLPATKALRDTPLARTACAARRATVRSEKENFIYSERTVLLRPVPSSATGGMSAVPDPASRGAALDELQLEFNLLDGLMVVGQGFVEQRRAGRRRARGRRRRFRCLRLSG